MIFLKENNVGPKWFYGENRNSIEKNIVVYFNLMIVDWQYKTTLHTQLKKVKYIGQVCLLFSNHTYLI